jgi:hypothetical protein
MHPRERPSTQNHPQPTRYNPQRFQAKIAGFGRQRRWSGTFSGDHAAQGRAREHTPRYAGRLSAMHKVIDPFLAGFQRFQQKYFAGEAHLYAELSRGQSPKVLIIACCDSRVDPALISDCAPGDLFVLRNVANLVPPCEAGTSHYWPQEERITLDGRDIRQLAANELRATFGVVPQETVPLPAHCSSAPRC